MGWDTYIYIEELIKDDQGNEEWVCINKNQTDFWAGSGTIIDEIFKEDFLKDDWHTDPVDFDYDYPENFKRYCEWSYADYGNAFTGIIYIWNKIRITYASVF